MSFNQYNPIGVSRDSINVNINLPPAANQFREGVSNLGQTINVSGNLGSLVTEPAGVNSFGHNSNNLNPNTPSGFIQETKAGQIREEARQKVYENPGIALSTIPEKPNDSGTIFNLNKPEISEEFEREMENLKVLLKDIYTGTLNQNDALSDQKMNEPYLRKFFSKYFENYYKIKTNTLAIMLAGLYFALDDLEGAKTNLDRIENPDNIDDNNDNAGIHRAYYIMQANLEIEAKNFKKARELLKKCWNIQQRYFSDGKEHFLDFLTTSMGKIHLNEGNLEEAEKCFREALALRLSSNNPRLISSSFNDLALLCIQKKTEVRPTEVDALRKQGSKYLEEAVKYDKIFKEEVKTDRYNILSGQVDFKRPILNRTKAAL